MSFYFPKSEYYKYLSDQYDLDIFLYDSKKIIHIATAGMEMINSLNQINFDPIANFRTILSYRRSFQVEFLQTIVRDNLTSEEDYLYFFNFLAKRGFYSYDKVDIDNNEDFTFQLISKPKYDKRIHIPSLDVNVGDVQSNRVLNYDLNFIEAKKDFPENFDYFDISEYL